MPDISMCAGDKDCPFAKNCYRSERSGTKPTEYRQAYSAFEWQLVHDKAPWCDHYWPLDAQFKPLPVFATMAA